MAYNNQYPAMKLFTPLLLFLALFAACANEQRNHPRELTDEEKNIDLVISKAVFKDLEGNDVRVSDYKGKVVLVDFWETWCGPCLQVFPALDSLLTEFPDDFAVIAANLNNSDTDEDVRAFAEKNPYRFVFALDKNNVGDEVITLGIPFKVFIDPAGYLIKTELGSAGTQGDYEKAKTIIEAYKQTEPQP